MLLMISAFNCSFVIGTFYTSLQFTINRAYSPVIRG